MSVVAEESGAPSAAVELPVLRLKRGEDRRLRAGHLWVFSNEVDNDATPLSGFAVGAMARVLSERDLFLGYAYVNPHALICARILSRSPLHPPDRSWLEHRLKVALALRERIYAAPYYRVVFGESDGLPGVIADRYADTLVVQLLSCGAERWREEITGALAESTGCPHVYERSDADVRTLEGLEPRSGILRGTPAAAIEILEGERRLNSAMIPVEPVSRSAAFNDREGR